jgi:hypothetical protein
MCTSPRHERDPSAADQPILSIRASVPGADACGFIADALRDVRAFMQEHRIRAAGAPFSICRPHGAAVDIEVGWPTAGPATGTGRIHAGSLPGSLARQAGDDPDPLE